MRDRFYRLHATEQNRASTPLRNALDERALLMSKKHETIIILEHMGASNTGGQPVCGCVDNGVVGDPLALMKYSG